VLNAAKIRKLTRAYRAASDHQPVKRTHAADVRTLPPWLKSAAKGLAGAFGCLVALVVAAGCLFVLIWWAAWHGM